MITKEVLLQTIIACVITGFLWGFVAGRMWQAMRKP
jgi:hypothetical protein